MTKPPSAIEQLESLSLELPEKGAKAKVPSRLSDPKTVRSLYQDCIWQDQNSAVARVRIQANKDGEPPFNQAALVASGQGSRANANFLMMQDLIAKANKGYNDIFLSPKTLMTLEVEGGEPGEQMNYARIISTELTRTIRKWSDFIPNAQQLVDQFVTHGVAVEYPPDAIDFRFNVCGLGEFQIPRQTKASASKVPYAIARQDIGVPELYDAIRNEEQAATLGWDIPAVKAAISRATTATPQGLIGDLDKMQQQVKNNDIGYSKMFSHIPVLHIWVKEFDGTFSFYITEKDNPDGKFLYSQPSRYSSVAEAFNFFCYGIGNGTYHSIRGLGNMLFALTALHNRMMSQAADSSMLEGSVMIQAESGNALQEASVNYLGPFSLLSPGFTVVDKQMPRSSGATLPYLGEVKSLMGQVSSRFNAPEKSANQTYQNKDSINADLEAAAGGDSGAIDLFYAAWDVTIRRMCRRIIKGPKTDPLVAEFHKRVARAGITQEILDSVDHDSTYAYRALGAGSPAARSIGFKRLLELLPQLDEIGRKNLIYQFVADIVGYQNAEEFASPSPDVRLGPEAGQAELENILLMQGNPIQVLPYQMHGTHVQIHIPPLMQTLNGVEDGSIDPMQVLPGLQASLDHIAAHGEELARDPTQAALYGQVKEAVNNLQQVVTNMDRKIKAAQRKATEAGAPQEDGTQADPKAINDQKVGEIKLALEQFKLEAAQQKHNLEMSALQAKTAQSLALNDAKGAAAIQMKQRFPGTTYGERQ